MGVVGSELRDEPALNSSELRLSEPSLNPLLMELLSSQLQRERARKRVRERKRKRGKERRKWEVNARSSDRLCKIITQDT